MTSGYMAVLFILIGRMPLLAPTLDNADQLFGLGITPGFYVHHNHTEVADQDPTSGSRAYLLLLLLLKTQKVL